MSRRLAIAATTLSALTLAGCARTVATIAEAPPPPPPVVEVAPPQVALTAINRNLTRAATLWHVRVGLNVAALACRGGSEGTIVAGYNALLTAQKAALADTEKQLSAEYQARGGNWRDTYDDAMTKLYNFYSQAQARDAFCAAAGEVLTDSATLTTAALDTFATDSLAKLDRPFAIAFQPMQVASASYAPRALPVATMASSALVAPAAAPTLRVDVDDLNQ